MISDGKELLIAFHEGDVPNEAGDKKEERTAAIWTNYNALVWTLQMLFSKLQETGKKSHEQYVLSPRPIDIALQRYVHLWALYFPINASSSFQTMYWTFSIWSSSVLFRACFKSQSESLAHLLGSQEKLFAS